MTSPHPARPLAGSPSARPSPGAGAPGAGIGGARLVLAVSLVLIALNLRPVFSSVAALLPEIMAGTGLRPVGASLLTTLPVLCLGLFAPLAPLLAGRFGAERTLLGVVGLVTAGTALRAFGTVPALLGGAVLAGAAIAVGNVLLPSLVKRDFPDRLALMTGLFTMALSAGAAAAAGLTVPLRTLLHGSWPAALGVWAVPGAAAFCLWAIVGRRERSASASLAGRAAGLWGRALAWQITLFMGLQSAMAYIVFGYLAPILRERGLPAGTAGAVVSWSVAVQCVACLLAPALAVRRADQRLVNVVFFALAVAGFAACVFAPLDLALVSVTAQGFGQGGLIALAMTAIVLRSADARVAAALSAMAQGVGYTLAAAGPLCVGVLRGVTGGYGAAALLFAGLGAAGAACAYKAGRPRVLAAPATRPPG